MRRWRTRRRPPAVPDSPAAPGPPAAPDPSPDPDPAPPEAVGDGPRPAAFPDGHFYSPVVNTADMEARRLEIWPSEPEVPGIEFDDEFEQQVLRELMPRYLADFDYAENGTDDAPDLRFFIRNGQFSYLDCRVLFTLLRHWRPARMIEVGSGFSTLLSADVNQRFLGGAMELICIEPYPRPFLTAGVPGVSELVTERVELSDPRRFETLRAGDVLFIDSSHVAKTGSDVNMLYFEVLPRLAQGVRVHIHDIFLPADYPQHWVIGENRSWNEQYVVRALLMDSTRYRPVFGCAHAFSFHPDLVAGALGRPPGQAYGGGSLWVDVASPR